MDQCRFWYYYRIIIKPNRALVFKKKRKSLQSSQSSLCFVKLKRPALAFKHENYLKERRKPKKKWFAWWHSEHKMEKSAYKGIYRIRSKVQFLGKFLEQSTQIWPKFELSAPQIVILENRIRTLYQSGYSRQCCFTLTKCKM